MITALQNLSVVLKKAESYADEKGIPHSKILEAKLADDMAPLPSQVQRASDAVKGTITMVTGCENTVWEDNETTFEQLQARITKTVEYLQAVKPEAMNEKEDAEVIIKRPFGEYKFTGTSCVLQMGLPNVYFHCAAAYNIVRQAGAPIGKLTWLMGGDALPSKKY